MPEHEARRRAVYDHDNEESRPAGRRRRQVADWGVEEEIFDHMPGRRFERRRHQDIPRGDAHDGRRTIVIDTGDGDLPPDRPAPADEEFATREDALRARRVHDALWDGDEPFADERPAASAPRLADDHPAAGEDRWTAASGDGWTAASGDRWTAAGDDRWTAAGDDRWTAAGEDRWTAAGGDRWTAADAAAAESGDEPVREAAARTDGVVCGGQAGRRTVKIGGRPAEFHGPPARARHQPPRAMHERLGPRPERIAAWAFALGVLLILIAVATANAAVPA